MLKIWWISNLIATLWYCRYKTEFGFCIDDRSVIVDDIRVRGVASTGIKKDVALPKAVTAAHPVKVIENLISNFMCSIVHKMVMMVIKRAVEFVRM